MLTESKKLQLIVTEPKFVGKLQRMEALSVELSKLSGSFTFALQKSLGRPEGMWLLNITWSNYGSSYIPGGHDEVTYVVLKKRVKGWIRSKWLNVMMYQRDYGHDTREERRHMFTFEYDVVDVLDMISDELEAQIAKASQATTQHREQFRRVVDEHPRVEKDRFDRIDLL